MLRKTIRVPVRVVLKIEEAITPVEDDAVIEELRKAVAVLTTRAGGIVLGVSSQQLSSLRPRACV